MQAKIADFYGAYTDTDSIDRAGLKPAAPTLESIAAIKTRRQLARWLGDAQGRIGTPIGLWVMADFENPRINRALTWQGGLGMPDRDYYLKDDERLKKARAAYETYLTTLANLAGERAPQVVARGRSGAGDADRAGALGPRSRTATRSRSTTRWTVQALAASAPGFRLARLPRGGWPAPGRQALGLAAQRGHRHCQVAGGRVDLAQWRQYLKLRVLDESAAVLPKGLS